MLLGDMKKRGREMYEQEKNRIGKVEGECEGKKKRKKKNKQRKDYSPINSEHHDLQGDLDRFV